MTIAHSQEWGAFPLLLEEESSLGEIVRSHMRLH